VDVDPRFWAGRRVLLTGHTGFKGTWLALWLRSLGAEVVGLSHAVPPAPAMFPASGLEADLDHRLGDIRDAEAVAATVAAARPEVVLHLAAQPLVRLSYSRPLETYATNVMGTANVLEAIRHADGVRAVVVVTSDKVYEDTGEQRGYAEDDALGGSDPYASSKACAEHVAVAYRRAFFAPAGVTRVATARAGNVIGGGDYAADRLIPDLIRGARDGVSVPIRRPDAVRPWQHVLCPLAGYLLLAQALWDDADAQGAWNFGPDAEDARPVGWIAAQLSERWPGGLAHHLDDDGSHPHETPHLAIDSAKSRARLGWDPAWDLAQALDAIVEWTLAVDGGASLPATCLAQIDAYSRAATA